MHRVLVVRAAPHLVSAAAAAAALVVVPPVRAEGPAVPARPQQEAVGQRRRCGAVVEVGRVAVVVAVVGLQGGHPARVVVVVPARAPAPPIHRRTRFLTLSHTNASSSLPRASRENAARSRFFRLRPLASSRHSSCRYLSFLPSYFHAQTFRFLPPRTFPHSLAPFLSNTCNLPPSFPTRRLPRPRTARDYCRKHTGTRHS